MTSPTSRRLRDLAALVVVLLVGAGVAVGLLGGSDDVPDSPGASDGRPKWDWSAEPEVRLEGRAKGPRTSRLPPGLRPDVAHVLVVSIDGLSSEAVRTLGPEGLPHLARLGREGAATLEARSSVEMTVTLPNHTSMVTGRRIDAARGGHDVTVNDDDGSTVQENAGEPVDSVFTVVHEAGGETALLTTKDKFRVLERSWPAAIDDFVPDPDPDALTTRAVAEVVEDRDALTFLHLGQADAAGHAAGWLSPAYLDAVRAADAQVGRVLDALDDRPRLAARTAVVVTADHGGTGRDHGDVEDPRNYRIPFWVRAPGVLAGSDLYAVDPDVADPGTGRPDYDVVPPPVRNGDVANLVTTLLGLEPVPGSELDADQHLLD